MSLALDVRAPWRRSIALAAAIAVEAQVALAIGAVVAGHADALPVLTVALALASAWLVPWGMGAQAANAGAAALCLGAVAATAPASDGVAESTATAWVALLGSVGVAFELARQRRQRHRAEEEERASTRALRDEIVLAETAANAAQELAATPDAMVVVETLCRLETRLLGCERSYTFLRDRLDPTSFVAVAAAGDRAWEVRRAPRIPERLLTRVLDRPTEPLVLCDRDLEPAAGGTAIHTGLVEGSEVVGIQVAVRRETRPFSATEVELARRLAATASTALAQVRLREARDAARAAGSALATRVWRELRTPLGSIVRLSEQAQDPSVPASERHALVERIAGTARDVLHRLEHLERGGPSPAGRHEPDARG